MEEIAGRYEHHFLMNRSTQIINEGIWAKHYSSNHQILLVGEGDFSFALSLAVSFRSGFNIVASSIDSYDVVLRKYKRAKRNLDHLSRLGVQLLYGVDARTMKLHVDLHMRNFLKNASRMLRPNGEVHVTHKTKYPFDCWNIEELASQSCLTLLECVEFKLGDYPGYNNKRGDGSRSDEPFPLGKCCTFKFILSTTKKSTTSYHTNHQEPLQILLQRPNAILLKNKAPVIDSGECFRIFVEYFNHARSTYGQTDSCLLTSVLNHLRFGFQRYMTEDHGRWLIGYVNLLGELRSLSERRIEFLQNRLLEVDHRRCL
ncbi:protein of unknown function DUF2431 [Cynara cardunculus var. scolymus]|uniref:25S rRNA (uridine-N(3))-methyltransferase BMT5-like domain-containing protein n=1 Tax=Cynara cardunculus var. scolymus TaxID=59895 RepID=A0A103YK20_CYNCS|nr:protein of unknown function DUF2431 [Cynara cardunculus var. scolymus]